MEQFKTKKEGFKEIRTAIIIKTLPIILLAGFTGLALSQYNSNVEESDLSTFLFIGTIVLATLILGLFRGINRQKVIFESYVLTFDQNAIIREQHHTPSIIISHQDVQEIIKNPNGSFSIKGDSNVDMIIVPSQIENYDKLEKMLSDLRPIIIKDSEPLIQKFRGLISVLTIGIMAVVFISQDKWIVGVLGAILLLLFGYSFIQVQKSKNLDSNTKNGVWWLILVAISIIGVMYFKLTS